MNVYITPELTQAIINDMLANTAVALPVYIALAAVFIGISAVPLIINYFSREAFTKD